VADITSYTVIIGKKRGGSAPPQAVVDSLVPDTTEDAILSSSRGKNPPCRKGGWRLRGERKKKNP